MEESTDLKKSMISLGEQERGRTISTDQPTKNDSWRGISATCSSVAVGSVVAVGNIDMVSTNKVLCVQDVMTHLFYNLLYKMSHYFLGRLWVSWRYLMHLVNQN